MQLIRSPRARYAKRLGGLAADTSGNVLIEFALGLPLLLLAGLWGIELTHFAITNQRVSQLTLELADNASRVGLFSGQTTIQLREADINDVLQQTRLHGDAIGLATNGRVTISSLENVQRSFDTAATQRIHWQRCLGMKRGAGYDSSYGTTATTAGTMPTNTADANKPEYAGIAAASGMGDAGSQVSAPANSGVMFVEVNYLYTPLVGMGWFSSQQRLHFIASFIVRDNRDFTQIYNPPTAAAKSTCDLYTS